MLPEYREELLFCRKGANAGSGIGTSWLRVRLVVEYRLDFPRSFISDFFHGRLYGSFSSPNPPIDRLWLTLFLLRRYMKRTKGITKITTPRRMPTTIGTTLSFAPNEVLSLDVKSADCEAAACSEAADAEIAFVVEDGIG